MVSKDCTACSMHALLPVTFLALIWIQAAALCRDRATERVDGRAAPLLLSTAR